MPRCSGIYSPLLSLVMSGSLGRTKGNFEQNNTHGACVGSYYQRKFRRQALALLEFRQDVDDDTLAHVRAIEAGAGERINGLFRNGA